LYDPDETRLSFHMKPKSSKLVSAFSELVKKFLERFKNFDLDNICLMIVGVEGEVDNVNFQKKKVFKIGACLYAITCAVVHVVGRWWER
jgi:alkyldihydroxyacetonephosphate synthase